MYLLPKILEYLTSFIESGKSIGTKTFYIEKDATLKILLLEDGEITWFTLPQAPKFSSQKLSPSAQNYL